MVEDDDFLRLCYKRYVKKFGGMNPLWVVETGDEAVDQLEANAPDLVLSDLSLPDMAGIEVIRRIREVALSVPLLVVSGHDDPEQITAAFDAGANGYVLKGEFREVVKAAQTVLGGTVYLSDALAETLPAWLKRL